MKELSIKKTKPIDTNVIELFHRIDETRIQLGQKPFFYDGDKCLYDEEKLKKVADALQKDYETMCVERSNQAPKEIAGSTLIVEFARGGADGSEMPLTWGYEKNLALLNNAIEKKEKAEEKDT